ncbi:Prokaryotic ubiquitin-like protein Pup [Corynebacterium urogenitale]|uniref:Prokaryotic ubiquitin-like protein Pup n=1 Tax=Corynebacterium urogenitale TaxID=2487892 RepID=A0A5J6ZBX7_9CORY|nr:ubiquitin-like protein Pup [Corynebacterium urogenitale]QFQ02330.1 Prokaryotic ubiquitin-like protein Pup [Corynebacterium urogenitale]
MTTGGQVHAGGGRGEDNNDPLDPQGAAGGQEQIGVTGTDDLLDEIDGLLENNAEEFVRSYVQKGGQ